MILSISNIAWSPSEKLKAYSLLLSNNFEGLEIAPGLFFSHLDDPVSPSNKDIFRAKAELNLYDLKLVSMQSLLYGKKEAQLFGNKQQRDLFHDELIKIINLAERLEIPNLVFGSPTNRSIPSHISSSEAEDIAISMFSRLGDVAMSSGTCISLEPNPKEYGTNFINNMEEAVSFIKKINSSGIKAILDVGSIKMNDDYDDLRQIVYDSRDFLNHVHVSEPYLGPAPESSFEYEILHNLLYEFGYKKAISIEMQNKNCPLDYIDNLMKKMTKINLSTGS